VKFVAWQKVLGSAGCQPAVLGSLPSTRFARVISWNLFDCPNCRQAAGKLPAAAGWQPALPKEK
jgi:hypothetical protein